MLGGARSGKSEAAEALAATGGCPVTYVATGSPSDPLMAARIAEHTARRPAGWHTVEVGPGGDLAGTLAGLTGPILLDSLGTWLAGSPGFVVGRLLLASTLADRSEDTVVVSEEVGLGVHPLSEAGRQFRDALGQLNRAVADVADRVLLVVAGRALHLDAL